MRQIYKGVVCMMVKLLYIRICTNMTHIECNVVHQALENEHKSHDRRSVG